VAEGNEENPSNTEQPLLHSIELVSNTFGAPNIIATGKKLLKNWA
jgi:hypothetical protein